MLGGVLATFLYGCVMGAILLFFVNRAQKNPLWWAVAPAILLPCVEPGFNVEDVSNHIVKGSVVFVIVWKLYPPVQRLLAPLTDDPTAHDGEGIDDAPSPFDDVVTDH
jgi:hypothetical protein